MKPITRRILLADLGRGMAGALVITACGSASDSPSPTTVATPTTVAPATEPAGTGAATRPAVTVPSEFEWRRVVIGSVSAYLLSKDGEVAVVDTGVPNSEAAIGDGLAQLGLGWDSVGHVILTHKHPDHVGSLDAVLGLATAATAYMGAEDIPAINSVRTVTAVGDGDLVMGLSIIDTPGHTPGHISVLDPGRLLVAGDAMNGVDGGVAGPNPSFTEDMTLANASVVKMAGFEFDTVVFGHGDPVTTNASVLVGELAATL